MADVQRMADSLFNAVSTYVLRLIEPIVMRLEAIEKRQPEKGERGRDGVGAAGAAISRDGELMFTLSNGDLLNLGRVDGRDGLGFDDMTVDYDGERQVTFCFTQGDRMKKFPLMLPIVIDRGVYRAGEDYQKGDAVSFGGSLWIAQEATQDKPETSTAWRLAVKRGRDGRSVAK